MNNIVPAYTFNDVLIKPRYSTIESRKDVDLSVQFGDFLLTLPIIGAPMKSVMSFDMAVELAGQGGMGILHRFDTLESATNIGTEANKCIQEYEHATQYDIGVAIGAHDENMKQVEELYSNGFRVFCIDIAHGHCSMMEKMIEQCHNRFPGMFIIAGNVATAEGARALADWGADAVRCGIGGGRACETRKRCGVGVPQLYAMQEIWEEIEHMPNRPMIISDGGIKHVGDIAKALKYSDAVMVGSLISGTTETPGKVFKNEDGQYYKVYMGSASGENKVNSGQTNEYIEGIATQVPFRGKVKYILKEIKEGLQSAFSYTGSRNMEEFHKNCEFVHITSGGQQESKI